MTRKELVEQIKTKRTFLCVGLDPDLQKLPAHLKSVADPFFEFNKAIIDATADHCVCYKPNTAFYEAEGLKGMESLKKTIDYIRAKYPKHFIIADAKRGDIGNTSSMYAKAFFDHFGAHAITVAPYMGSDSVKPFLRQDGKWAIVLGLTSNEGANDFQLLKTGERELFSKVMETCASWGTNDNMMFVVGATQAKMLSGIRKIIPSHFLLIPGVGAQGGSLRETCEYGLNEDVGLLINSSRAIIYASGGTDFSERAGEEAAKVANEMKEMLKGKL
jgi:orotidine-5'-phosphate decarboxylase